MVNILIIALPAQAVIQRLCSYTYPV